MTYIYSVSIRWGSNTIPENERPICQYVFKTQAELDAYLQGVDDGNGWMDYEIIEDEEKSKPEPAPLSETPITP